MYRLYYRVKLAYEGYKLLGVRKDIAYGVNAVGVYAFWFIKKFTMCFLFSCEDYQTAKFRYEILLKGVQNDEAKRIINNSKR